MKHYLQNDFDFEIKKLIFRYEHCLEKNCFTSFEENDFLNIADHYNQEKFPSEAIHSLERGIAIFPKSRDLKKTQIRLLIQYNHPNLAQELLQKREGSVLAESDYDLLDVEDLFTKGDFSKALNKLDNLKKKYQEPQIRSDIFVLESLIYEKQSQFDMAFKSINEALYYSPTHENALVRMLFCIEFTKKHKESIKIHQQLLQKEHYSALTWYNLGHSFYHEAMYEEAIEAFEFATIIDSKLDAAYYFCAEIYMFRGIYTRAIECYEKMINQFTISKPEVYLNLAQCHISTGNPELALVYLKHAWTLDEDPQVLFLRAEAHRYQKKYDEAFKNYFEVLELDDTREDVHIQLATLFFERCEYEKSRLHFEIALEAAPEMSDYWIQYASLFLNIGEVHQAEIILNKAKEYNYCAKILFCQAACLMLIGKKKMGFTTLEEAIKIDINQQGVIFEFAEELEDDISVNAILRYYNGENKN